MDYGRSSGGYDYYRGGCSPSPHGGRFPRDDSRRDGYSPRRQGWPEGGRGRSPGKNSSSWKRGSSPRYRRSRSRSSSMRRSRSRGRKYSRSPRRRSRRRSSSYEYGKRFKRGSSSSSSRSRSRSGSRNGRTKQQPNEDFYKSMYADREPNQPQAYLHPAHSVNSAAGNVAHPAQVSRSIENTTLTNPLGFAALPQAYAAPSQKQIYSQNLDDEDRFLYGDDASIPVKKKQENPVEVMKPAPPQQQQRPVNPKKDEKTVTPGGFDSNALKNVLKAIGFDFEMSAQKSQSTDSKTEAKKPVPPPKPNPVPAPKAPVEPPRQIQTVGSSHATPAQPSVPVQPVSMPSMPQYYQRYDPYNQNSTVTYTPQVPIPTPVAPQATPLGYPMTIPDPNNPGGTLLVYRPIAQPAPVQQPPHVAYHHQQQQQVAPVQPQPQVSQQHAGGRIVLPPQRSNPVPPPKVKKSDKELRQERLNYLQEELEKLKKQQNELLRKKRREKDGHKDPLIKKNNLLQAGVEEQIREIRQAAERAAGIASDTSDDNEVEDGDDQKKVEEDKESKYEYVDPGNHWCRLCNTFTDDLATFLSHLHSKAHRKAIDPYERPWAEGEKKKKNAVQKKSKKSVKGSEFLIPITGYYCTVCQMFSGDQICADDHLKSYQHNSTYKKHCKKNPSYEKKYKKKKKAALEAAASSNGKKKETKQEVEVKFINTPIKEEPKWVEKSPPKYQERETKYEPLPSYEEEYESQKGADKRYGEEYESQKGADKRYEEEYESQKGADKRYKVERERERDHRRVDEEREPRRSSSRRSYEEHKEERKVPKKYSEEYAEPARPADHVRQKKKGWSPGYDEYERQQDDRYEDSEKRRKEGKNKRSRSRDRGARWVEKSQPEEPTRNREPDRGGRWVEKPPAEEPRRVLPTHNDNIISPGARAPSAGFGRFKWNSFSKKSRFDQTSADNASSHAPPMEPQDSKNGDVATKGKIAIKITGKTQYPPRFSSTSNALASKSGISSAEQEKRAATVMELQKKVEALKRENAFRNQLSSITIPSNRPTKVLKPNTAAVMLGTRTIGKHNTLLLAKHHKSKNKKEEEEIITHEIEADVSPPPPPVEDVHQPPPPGVFEPPPPGEEGFDMGDPAGDDAKSEASGISMELASDED